MAKVDWEKANRSQRYRNSYQPLITKKQREYLGVLGYEADNTMTLREASALIDKLKRVKEGAL